MKRERPKGTFPAAEKAPDVGVILFQKMLTTAA